MLILLQVLLCLVVVGATVISIRRDPRWLGNAYLLGLSLLVLIPVVVPGGFVTAGIGTVVLGVLSPLAALVLAGFLIANGLTMVRREGRSLGHLLSLVAGLAMVAVVVLGWFWALTGLEKRLADR